MRRAEAALACWAAPGLIWPLQWLALWPLIAALVNRGEVSGALAHARRLLSLPTEQRRSEPLRAGVAAALQEEEQSGPDAAKDALQLCIERAHHDRLL